MSFSKLAASNRKSVVNSQLLNERPTLILAAAAKPVITPEKGNSKKRSCEDGLQQSGRKVRAAAMAKPRAAKVTPTADGIRSGSFIVEHTHRTMTLIEERFYTKEKPWVPPPTLKVATACSGSEMPKVVLNLMQQGSRRFGKGFKFEFLWSCELDQAKAEWIARLDKSMGSKRCIFKDVCTLCSGNAECWLHGRKCKVDRCNIFIAGFSCKDLSTANKNRSSNGSVLNDDSSPGGTATTWKGVKQFLDSHFPELLFLENVDTLAQDHTGNGESTDKTETKQDKCNKDILESELHARHYETQWVVVEGNDFGVAVRRRRVYIIGIRRVAPHKLYVDAGSVGGYDQLFKRFLDLVKLCRVDPCPWDALMQDNDSDVRNVACPPVILRSAL